MASKYSNMKQKLLVDCSEVAHMAMYSTLVAVARHPCGHH